MISSMLQYIQKSPDCFHAVENLRQRLLSEGYTQLTAGEWTLIPGGKYFVTKNGSSLMAFRVPQDRPTGFVLTASHSDSPCFRLRDHAELTGEFVRLSAERYGGMINDCWLDRPLSVAGRVLVRRENGLDMRLVDMKKDMALIPRVAIHLHTLHRLRPRDWRQHAEHQRIWPRQRTLPLSHGLLCWSECNVLT